MNDPSPPKPVPPLRDPLLYGDSHPPIDFAAIEARQQRKQQLQDHFDSTLDLLVGQLTALATPIQQWYLEYLSDPANAYVDQREVVPQTAQLLQIYRQLDRFLKLQHEIDRARMAPPQVPQFSIRQRGEKSPI
jgi:hypothetical protein